MLLRVATWAVLAHLAGDYLFQSHWMAVEKVKRWWPAIAHGAVYVPPFLLLTRSPWALLIIGGTHVVLDHYRAARWLVWAGNLIAPRESWVPWRQAAANQGFPAEVPAGLAAGLLIVADNTIHLCINTAALVWLA